MDQNEIYERIKKALAEAPRNHRMRTLHSQVIKYAEELKGVTGKEFCESTSLRKSFGTEFNKMKNLAPHLRDAGLDPSKL